MKLLTIEKMVSIKKCISILFILFFLFITISCNSKLFQKTYPPLEKGTLDLKNWDFSTKGSCSLKGKWEFYWLKLLEPPDFTAKSQPKPDGFFLIPGSWNSYTLNNGKKTESNGYGTFRLCVKNYKPRKKMKMHIKSLSTSYILWINGQKIAAKGKVGRSRDTYTPQVSDVLVDLPPLPESFEIVLQVANFHYKHGGPNNTILIGEADSVHKNFFLTFSLNWIITGMIFIIGLYHLLFFLQRKESQFTLYYGFFCLINSCWIIMAKNMIPFIFPADDIFIPLLKIEYFTYHLLVASFLTFITNLFKVVIHKFILYAFIITGFTFALMGIAAPTWFVSQNTVSLFNIIALSGTIYAFIVMLVAIKKGNKQAMVTSFTFFIIFIFAINDFLNGMEIIRTGYFNHYAFLIYIFVQAGIISSIFQEAFKKSQFYTTQLDELNKNLELKVRLRTRKLQKANSIITRKTANILESIEYGKIIQDSILPEKALFETAFSDYFIYCKQKDIVGGDFYWMSRVTRDSYLIGVIDCTGHGIPGAFMTMMTNSIINHIVYERCNDNPAEILSILDEIIIATLHQDNINAYSNDGLDMGLCYINYADDTLLYSGARRPLIFCREDSIELIKGDKQSIGYIRLQKSFSFNNYSLSIKKGDTFYLTSDGYTDQNGDTNMYSFGKKRLINLLGQINTFPLKKQEKILAGELEKYQGKETQLDDITIIGFKI